MIVCHVAEIPDAAVTGAVQKWNRGIMPTWEPEPEGERHGL